MDAEDFLPIAQVARELSVTAAAVHIALNEGRLPFTLVYGRKLISRADLDAYKERTRPGGEKPRGRPRKKGTGPTVSDSEAGA